MDGYAPLAVEFVTEVWMNFFSICTYLFRTCYTRSIVCVTPFAQHVQQSKHILIAIANLLPEEMGCCKTLLLR